MTVELKQTKEDFSIENTGVNNKRFYKLNGVTACIILIYSLVTMVLFIVIGGQPETAREAFEMLQENLWIGVLRLDILTIFIMPLYYLLFLGLYFALRKTQAAYVSLSVVLVFAGVTLLVATPSVFSWLDLNQKYAAAVTETEKIIFLAAGESVLASDMWHGSGARLGGILMQSGALIVSVIMLRAKCFKKSTAVVGILTHSLDLVHILLSFFSSAFSIILMAIAGPLYLIWFPLLARDFFRMEKER